MAYCFDCSYELVSKIPDDDNRKRLVCPKCSYIHYENPKIIVGILPYFEDRILLCRRAIEPGYGLWTIPSGFMECSESLEAGAKREAMEEAGITCQNLNLFVTYSIPRISQVYMLFSSELQSMHFSIGPETMDAQFFSLSDIPFESIAFSSVVFAIQKFIDHYPLVKHKFFMH